MLIDKIYFTSSIAESHLRLDSLLRQRFPKYSRSYFQFLIKQGYVLINGKSVKKREKLQPGDIIEVSFQVTPEIDLTPEPIDLEILYEDEHLIVINKPVGMVVYPAPGHYRGTFVNALLFHCKQIDSDDPLRPGIVHRLDKDTSGLLIAAKTRIAHTGLTDLFAKRKIEKIYLAICIGTPTEGLIDAPIARHPSRRKEMTVCMQGRASKTICRVLAQNGSLSLVKLKLLTGRTHQLRVHLKHIGTPILGDETYGNAAINKKFSTKRQLLHAYFINFFHPITQQILSLTASIPEDLRKVIELVDPQREKKSI
ncbi:Ribosomal large subunit pseudouridine synthase D [Candidatus Rhabdochlamydia oedothoracis]|uniref:Pseudouridine synthase n=1 Tax=Candidatus Rhabdochlamydia oedothoracis TaxID=2720720 RepID=A0ABX8V239_9BACT|nr:RluA family pseudouridine synthase [Candidatus Rhabdochlamydia sp. W815]KAG6559678.1 Ribosomal large subunit pseudouridine synthase D [Candidatus Rhabdochlamydia sp. W815]QYF49303.1 Ribosomal large subunit pseudouridine synthase D [Candidatus Rhabdochlamydia oedothoracis]